ncbi:MAG: hypothetical protein JSU06_02315 [Actinobacteria bacterium]|nr:hypothetical protein [Actinomycetota bacterium]
MIVSALGAAVLIVLATVVAGGFILRLAGRVAVVLGLLGAAVRGEPLGLLIAALGALMLWLGSSGPLDRRRRRAPE